MIAAFPTRLGILASGSAVPERVLTNEELSHRVETTDEWIVSRTGIRERRVAADDDTTTDLALAAGQQALDRSGLAPADIDHVVVATCTPDSFFPATAALVADRLGAHSAAAFDVSAACTGFVYAFAQAAAQIQSGMAENVLVIGSEIFTRLLDWDDRGTAILFGDGAGALVLSASAQPSEGVFAVELGADGSRADELYVHAFVGDTRHVHMHGSEVFKFATRVLVESVERVLARSAVDIDDVTWFVPHQANIRIIDHAVKRLEIDPGRVLTNLERYGNTSAASIPLVLDEAWREGRVRPGDRLLMIGFGGGLTWGACLTTWGGAAADGRDLT
jgi:3-oxoacyl-[acyl-carrier-protein] synthase-3